MNKTSKIMCIAGPTASGKSAAIAYLAKQRPIEVINVDSATIYTGMDIGTAKPSHEERKIIRHHLLDIVEPHQSYSVAQFCEDTLACIQEIQSRGHEPVLVGGTMMYYNALFKGLHDLPATDPAVRTQVTALVEEEGILSVYERLRAVDPDMANRLSPNDQQRVSRAYEIYLMTDKTMSEWLKADKPKGHEDKFQLMSLEPSERTVHHEVIRQRFYEMMDRGFLNEVRGLMQDARLHENLPSIRCVGYRQMWAHLLGQTTLDEAIELSVIATRQLAKRQMTWLRSYPNRMIVDSLSVNLNKNLEKVFANDRF